MLQNIALLQFLGGQLLHIAIFNRFFYHYCYCYCNSSEYYCQCLDVYIVVVYIEYVYIFLLTLQEKRGLCLVKCSCKILQNFAIFSLQKKPYSYSFHYEKITFVFHRPVYSLGGKKLQNSTKMKNVRSSFVCLRYIKHA